MKAFFIIVIFSMLPFSALGQDTIKHNVKDSVKVSLENSLNGAYTKFSDKSNIINIGIVGDNSVSYGNFKAASSSNYSLSFRDTILANEFVEKTNVGYGDIFLSNVYSHSFVRSIRNDNSFGIGYGRKFSVRKLEMSFSYAVLYQRTVYKSGSLNMVERSSFRTKIKYEGDLVGFSTELYYQPSFRSFEDYIVYGNAKLVLLPKKRLNFILQDAVNYISKSEVRMLHNLAFGVGYTFKK